jgi:agmatine deiminase
MIFKDLPKDMGYKMPAEWEKHEFTLMAWPVKEAEWPGDYEDILIAFADLVNKISNYEPVKLIIKKNLIKEVLKYLNKNIEFIEMNNDDSWVRDNGPTIIKNNEGKIAGVKWNFNAWGNKYPHGNDKLISEKILNLHNMPYFKPEIIMEGGSFHVDGEGTLLTTNECLLNNKRNPNLKKEDIEKYLMDYLGVNKIIWLDRGLDGDDTDGHIDNVACFARPSTIIIQKCDNKNDKDYEIYKRNYEILKNEKDSRGRKYEIIEIPKPEIQYFNGTKLTLSYINFYFVNNGIVMPVFGGENERNDNIAYEILKNLFKVRNISTVKGLVLARGGGNVHCLTQQFPMGEVLKF